MSVFIKNPNLPDGRVTTVICGSDDEKILSFFRKNEICVIKNEPNKLIEKAVSQHADMAAVHMGSDKIVIDCNQKQLIKALTGIGMTVYETERAVSGTYPDDIKLNFTVFGNNIIGNLKFAERAVTDLAITKTQINVKQGYCKCSVLVVRENAIITDDSSIYEKASENGIDCLLIRKGDISLDGHEYGFIGGSSGKISKDIIVFFGDIEKHSDYEKIKSFLEKYNCIYVCTDKDKLRDIGGIIAVTECV